VTGPPPANRDPLAGTARLIVDGTNLLHALGRRPGHAAPAATLIGRLRAAIPGAIRIELILDGPPEPGLRGTRIAAGLTVRHSGRITADAVIDRLVADAVGSGGTTEAARAAGAEILVVTDDNELGRSVRRRGGRTAGASWLVRRLERPAVGGASIGARRRPVTPERGSGAPGDDGPDGDAERRGWRPGRGATKKTGNPRRGRPR